VAGYSGTPLIKKLGIKDNFRTVFISSPDGFMDDLGKLPDNITVLSRPKPPLDFALLFVKSRFILEGTFTQLAGMLAPTGMIWVSWPKKASGVTTDLNFDVVQKIGLEAGLVDVKICAVNDIWYGLKFVIRVKDRKK
jgi:hypothetical protein